MNIMKKNIILKSNNIFLSENNINNILSQIKNNILHKYKINLSYKISTKVYNYFNELKFHNYNFNKDESINEIIENLNKMTLKLITELIVNNTKLQLKYQNEINNIGSIYNDIIYQSMLIWMVLI